MNVHASFSNIINCICGIIMLCCSSLAADIERELQHQIDEINISLNVCEWSEMEKEYLRGRSEGLFRAIEIVHEHEKSYIR